MPRNKRHNANGLACMSLAILTALMFCAGCGDDDPLGRVEVRISVQIDGQAAGDGSLVLRPTPGVKCPLIKVPVVDGAGYLPRSQGPVPGVYRATYRPAEVQDNITDHLSKSGRVTPGSSGPVVSMNRTSDGEKIVLPKGDMEFTVPDQDPAVVTISFDSA